MSNRLIVTWNGLRPAVCGEGDRLAVEDHGVHGQRQCRLDHLWDPLGDVRQAPGEGPHLVADPAVWASMGCTGWRSRSRTRPCGLCVQTEDIDEAASQAARPLVLSARVNSSRARDRVALIRKRLRPYRDTAAAGTFEEPYRKTSSGVPPQPDES